MKIKSKTAVAKVCPRCGEQSLECFSNHSYCANCNYDEVYNSGELYSIPRWVTEVLKTAKPKSLLREIRINKEEMALENAI